MSNITAGNQQQIQQVLEQGVVMSLVDVLKGSDFKAQREAVWAITNITSGGSTDQIIQLIEKYPVIQPFCDLLSSKDTRTLSVILTGLQALFKTAEAVKGVDSLCELLETIGGLDRLEALQNHENEEIYEKAYVLIDTYFSDAVSLIKFYLRQYIYIYRFNLFRLMRLKEWHHRNTTEHLHSILKAKAKTEVVSVSKSIHCHHSFELIEKFQIPIIYELDVCA